MIERISIADLGVIERAEVELSPGFTAVTGETGAGKTMVVTAFGLLLGQRAEAGAVRRGANSASVDADMDIPLTHPAWIRSVEAGAQLPDEQSPEPLILGRSLSAKGRSRASIAGRSVPISVLADIGAELVTVHGQNDQLRLKSALAQRRALDAYAGADLQQLLSQYQQNFTRYRELIQEHHEITTDEQRRRREAEQLQQAIAAISAVEPVPGEEAELKNETLRLENIESLRAGTRAAQAAISGSETEELSDTAAASAAQLLETATGSLTSLDHRDAALEQIIAQISEAGSLLSDAATELGLYAAHLDESGPERLSEIHQRRADIERLCKLYGPSVEEVIGYAEQAQLRLETLEGDTDRIEQLSKLSEEAEAALWRDASTLRDRRRAAAEKLAAAVGQELSALSMPHAQVIFAVEDTEELHDQGADTVAFLLAPHAGADPMPIGKNASGGELSRLMLALEVVLAQQSSTPTFIFDEIDAGVGGKAAAQIGERLAALAEHAQVIVVTHLPQVAAWADTHVRVHKTSDAQAAVTASDVAVLDKTQRVAELARMLAGQEDSASARSHAEELLYHAHGHQRARDARLESRGASQ